MTLTPHQQKVFNKIMEFIEHPESGVFILTGFAGTGKTFLLQEIARNLTNNKKKFSLLASTGRAAAVLRAKTEFTARTIHSELYIFSQIEGDDVEIAEDAPIDEYGQMRLFFNIRQTDKAKSKIYIIDEASMVSDTNTSINSYANFGSGYLLSDLIKITGVNKVLFTGDPCQLPPIGDEVSPALSVDWFKAKKYRVNNACLTEIIRQNEGNGILTLATKVRSLMDKKFETRWVKLNARDVPNIAILSEESMKELYHDVTVKEGYDQNIAISHSNRNCLELNHYIRIKRYNDPNKKLQVGEILMVTQNNYIVPLVNGDFVEVIAIGDSFYHIGFSFVYITVKAKHNDLDYHILLCKNTLYQNTGNLNKDQQRILMIDFRRRMAKEGIKPMTQEYLTALLEDVYLNSLRASFGYAVTCHKSQGGEWDNVFLFLNKGMYQMQTTNLIKWWYTAITRAKKKLYITDGWWIK